MRLGNERLTAPPRRVMATALCTSVSTLAACTSDAEPEALPAALPTVRTAIGPPRVTEAADPRRLRVKRRRFEVRWSSLALDRFWAGELADEYGVRFDRPDELVRYRGDDPVTCGKTTVRRPRGDRTSPAQACQSTRTPIAQRRAEPTARCNHGESG